MKLFKNVDIADLPAILRDGILPVSVTGNDNWNGRSNTTDPNLVYLFKAINAGDSFPKSYGTALVEVDIENAAEHAMSGRDAHRNDYIEYVAPAVSASDIIRVYIPEIFRSRMTFTVDPITYCGISFDVFDENTGSIRAVTEAEKDVFGAKANFTSTSAMNFFRAEMPDHTMLDAYNVRYNI